jgi:hypothetical protein
MNSIASSEKVSSKDFALDFGFRFCRTLAAAADRLALRMDWRRPTPEFNFPRKRLRAIFKELRFTVLTAMTAA